MTALWTNLLPISAHGDSAKCVVSAKGVRVQYRDGSDRLCATSGLWNVPLGYGNENIAGALHEAAVRISYGGVFRWENTDAHHAAEALVALAGRDRYSKVIFSTGGSAANDLVMKVARQYHAIRKNPGRRIVIGLRGSYHGMTFGSSALTGENLGQELYGVDQRLIRHVPVNDIDAYQALMSRIGHQVAAVVLEPVLGTGTIALEADFIAAICESREREGFLLVADEVATAFGRVGPYFASTAWPSPPDMMILSKALTNGTCAASCVLVAPRIESAYRDCDAVLIHAETGAGSAISAAAINATLDEMRRLDITRLASSVSLMLDEGLTGLLGNTPGVSAHTGTGAFRSLRIEDADGRPAEREAASELVVAVRQRGAVVYPGVEGLQLIPALTYTLDDMNQLMSCISAGILAWRERPSRSSDPW